LTPVWTIFLPFLSEPKEQIYRAEGLSVMAIQSLLASGTRCFQNYEFVCAANRRLLLDLSTVGDELSMLVFDVLMLDLNQTGGRT
jgi:hypothetical protein